jgi:hypothetical protein
MERKIISKELRGLYISKKKSVPEIAKIYKCSENKINYWLKRYRVNKRSISDAIYLKYNPNGDPFKVVFPRDIREAQLFGLGLGIYWGEGNKLNKNAVRVGNSDPAVLKTFINFLEKFFCVKKDDLKFHLHTFSDIDIEDCYNYWVDQLGVNRDQFYKPTVTITGKLGTYRKKSEYGVITIYYGNTKLRNKLVELLS